MRKSGFSEDEYVRRMADISVRYDDDWGAFRMGDRYYRRYDRANFFLPVGARQHSFDYRRLSWLWPAIVQWAYANAELLRWSLVDESVPLEDEVNVLGTFDIFDGGRRTNAIAIHMLRYWPALPELREVMLHERDDYLRSLGVEAIGEMGRRGAAYIRDIHDAIRKYWDDSCFLSDAIKALVRLNDKGASRLFRELYEAARARIDALSYEEAMKKEIGFICLIDDITTALIKLDPNMAREVLAMEFANPNPHVRYFTRRAFQFSPLKHELKLMERSYAPVVNSLPEDPDWVFRRGGIR